MILIVFMLNDCRIIFLGNFRVQGAKTQFARKDVTAKTDSAGDCYRPGCSFKKKALFLDDQMLLDC